MSGLLREWCINNINFEIDLRSSENKILRGGAFSGTKFDANCQLRDVADASSNNLDSCGFRLVRAYRINDDLEQDT